MAETTISAALCGVMEQALIEKGIDPTLAKALSQRACQRSKQLQQWQKRQFVKRVEGHVRQTENSLKHSKKQIDVFERKTANLDRVKLKQTLRA